MVDSRDEFNYKNALNAGGTTIMQASVKDRTAPNYVSNAERTVITSRNVAIRRIACSVKPKATLRDRESARSLRTASNRLEKEKNCVLSNPAALVYTSRTSLRLLKLYILIYLIYLLFQLFLLYVLNYIYKAFIYND